MMALVLSSCSHDDSQVNNGWVIYDLRPLQGGRVMYYGEDGGFYMLDVYAFIDYKRGIYPPSLFEIFVS